MLGGEVGELPCDVAAGLAKHLKVADHGVLDQGLGQETCLVDVVGVIADALHCGGDVPQVVHQPLR